MTREEALTRLRLRSHQAFCEYVENGNQENEEAALDVLAYDMAIAALREKAERERPPECDWCVYGAPLVWEFKPLGQALWVRIAGNSLMSETADIISEKEIRYCPMCGRTLISQNNPNQADENESGSFQSGNDHSEEASND